MPEATPSEFSMFRPEAPRNYDLLIKIFSEAGVDFYDGREAMRRSPLAKRGPLFPKGGVHWTELGALAAVERPIADLLQQRTGVSSHIVLDGVTKSPEAKGADADLLDLINLLWPDRSYGSLSVKAHVEGKPFSKAVGLFGSSFVGALQKVLSEAGVAPQVYAVTYMKVFFSCAACNAQLLQKGWESLVLHDTSAVIIEINETVFFGDPHYVDALIDGLTTAMETSELSARASRALRRARRALILCDELRRGPKSGRFSGAEAANRAASQ